MATRNRDPFDLLFYLLIALSLVPIWAAPFFPSQDGPSHLYNADIIRQYPWSHVPLFREFYMSSTYPFPNWTGHLILAALLSIAPVVIAEKLFLSAYVIGFALAFRYCIRGLNPQASAASLLAFPFMYNFPFQMGFYNFSTGVVLFFLCVGYWVRHHNRLTAGSMAALALFSLVLYFSHMVALTVACIAIGSLWAWFRYLDYRELKTRGENLNTFWRASALLAARTAVAFLPGLLLALWFVQHQAGEGNSKPIPLGGRVRELFQSGQAHGSSELASLIPWELCLIALGLVAIYSQWFGKDKTPRKLDGPLLLVLLLFVIYFVTPNNISGGGAVEPRVALYLWLAVCIWLGAQIWTRSTQRAIAAFATIATVALVATHTMQYRVLSGYLKEYLSASAHIKSHSTLLSIEVDRHKLLPLAEPTDSFRHAVDYIAAEKNLIDMTNYEACADYFPTHYLPQANPYELIGDAEFAPLKLDLLHYTQRSGRPLDYVMLWGRFDSQSLSRPDIQSVLGQLQRGYELIYTSPERGWVRLYQRKGNQVANAREAPGGRAS